MDKSQELTEWVDDAMNWNRTCSPTKKRERETKAFVAFAKVAIRHDPQVGLARESHGVERGRPSDKLNNAHIIAVRTIYHSKTTNIMHPRNHLKALHLSIFNHQTTMKKALQYWFDGSPSGLMVDGYLMLPLPLPSNH